MAYVAIDPGSLKSTTSVRALLRDRGADIQRAVNQAAQYGFQLTEKTITDEVRFPAGYLSSNKRLTLRPSYNPGDAAIIAARKHATSLAQFVKGSPGYGQRGGLAVQVLRRGGSTKLDKAFLMKTKAGKRGLGNVGVMMRVAAYDKMNARRLAKGVDPLREHRRGYMESTGAFSSKYEWNGLKPLYSVSVDQAFSTFRRKISADIEADLNVRVSNIFTGD